MKRHVFALEYQNYQSALICATLANIHRDPRRKAFSPADFMPGQAKRRQTADDMAHIAQQWSALYEAKEGEHG